MRKGTTPSFVFQLPFGVDQIANAKVTFCIGGEVKLEKYLCDCDAKDNEIVVRLSQDETFLFECNSPAKVQLRVVTVNGDALSSDVFDIFAFQCLDDEVIK